MQIKAVKTTLAGIRQLRELFLQEANCQIRYHACHERNWSDLYLLTAAGVEIGYGAIKGFESLAARDTVFEFYLIPTFRKHAIPAFGALLEASKAGYVECQSNVPFFTSLAYRFFQNIEASAVLFEDQPVTEYLLPEVIFRKKRPEDAIFDHQTEPVGDYLLESEGVVVATGGFFGHYNPPFADLYMEVAAGFRNRGLGSFLLQELKRECYLSGRIPAARCRIDNAASMATLQKTGFIIAGYLLAGEIKK